MNKPGWLARISIATPRMYNHHMRRLPGIAIVALMLMAWGCATPRVIGPEMKRYTASGLKPAAFMADPIANKSIEILIGGVIESVAVQDGGMFIQVTEHPIDHIGKPDVNAESLGMFAFLIPYVPKDETIAIGVPVTIAGIAGGTVKASSGDLVMEYPFIRSTNYLTFPEKQKFKFSFGLGRFRSVEDASTR